jgi:RimJ/RimL family protein N-acetyltransferase
MNASGFKFPDQIDGEFIILSRIEPSDAEFIYKLRTSKLAQYLNCPPGYSVQSQISWIKHRPKDEVNYLIYNKDSMRVGMVSIYDCDWVNGVSNVGRLLLKEEYIEKGSPYGLEALKVCYGFVFNVMKFRKISGTINSKNEKVYDLQIYLGMSEEGFFMDHVMLRGEPQHLYFLSLFKEDFPEYSNKIDRLLDKYRK